MWRFLLRRALRRLPARWAELDPATRRALQRFAGRRILLQLPLKMLAPLLKVWRRGQIPQAGDSADEEEGGLQVNLLLEFSPDGLPEVRPVWGELPECDLVVRFLPTRVEGNRWLGLRLLAVLRRYRPDLEEALEVWFGAGAAGSVGLVADGLKRLLPGRSPGGRAD